MVRMKKPNVLQKQDSIEHAGEQKIKDISEVHL